MSRRRNRTGLLKRLAVKKAAASPWVDALLRSRNQVERLRGNYALDANGAPTVPLDWMGGVAANGERTGSMARPVGSWGAYEQAAKHLSDLGLSIEDIRKCKSCGLWFLASSRKSEVCQECRPRKWPTKYRGRYRAAMNSQAGIKARVGRQE